MSNANMSIRICLLEAGVTHTELAEELGIHRVSLSRKLRTEISDDEKTRLLAAIDMIEKRKKIKKRKGGKKK